MSIPHEMTRTRTLERGVEEWSCTQCSRRLLFRCPPALERIVLDGGDEWAVHVGCSGTQLGAARAVGLGGLQQADRGWLAAHGIEWEPDDTP